MTSSYGVSQSCFDVCGDAFKHKNFLTSEEDTLSDISSVPQASSEEWTSTDDDNENDDHKILYGKDTEAYKAVMAALGSSVEVRMQETLLIFSYQLFMYVYKGLQEKVVQDKALPDEVLHSFRLDMELFQNWVKSWTDKKNSAQHLLSVYGYFNKEKNHGGYGVILRST